MVMSGSGAGVVDSGASMGAVTASPSTWEWECASDWRGSWFWCGGGCGGLSW
jgi:hypothetical protein